MLSWVNKVAKIIPTPPEFIPQPFDQIAHFELIKKYLKVLRLRREEEIANYQPSDWEKRTPTEQLQLAIYHAHQHDEEDNASLIKIWQIKWKNQERKRLQELQKLKNIKTNIKKSVILLFIHFKIIKHTTKIFFYAYFSFSVHQQHFQHLCGQLSSTTCWTMHW